jgi:GxxExxY protein
MKSIKPVSNHVNSLASQVVDAAVKVHKHLGPGLLEHVYEECFVYELRQRNVRVDTQVYVPLTYEGLQIDNALRLDVLVEDVIICELKAQQEEHPVWKAQLLSYLRLSGIQLGFILNFNVSLMKDGIKRYIYS